MTQYYSPPDQPTGAFDGIVREDGAWIPADEANRDWEEYQAWLKDGNTALPYPPEGVPLPVKEVAAKPAAAPAAPTSRTRK